jgi:hypothetical protein
MSRHVGRQLIRVSESQIFEPDWYQDGRGLHVQILTGPVGGGSWNLRADSGVDGIHFLSPGAQNTRTRVPVEKGGVVLYKTVGYRRIVVALWACAFLVSEPCYTAMS